MLRWAAVCRQGTTDPISTLEPWREWLPPDLHGFYKRVFDSIEALNHFLSHAVWRLVSLNVMHITLASVGKKRTAVFMAYRVAGLPWAPFMLGSPFFFSLGKRHILQTCHVKQHAFLVDPLGDLFVCL